jgi:predicted MFS family arabinose efflux permease
MIGLGFSAGLMASYKSSATWVPAERRSLANTAIMSFGALGLVVATEPTQYLVALVGWRNAFVIFAGLIMLAAVFILAVAPAKDTVGEPAPLGQQFAEMLAILRTPLFWRLAPLLGLTSGVQIGVQTLWAGPWLRDVMGLTREEVGRHLLYMAVAFMVGIFSVGLIADRLGRRGIGPMQVMLGFIVLYLLAQTLIVFQVDGLMFPAWLAVAAFGQVAVLAFPWFAARIGRELAGRANATINFSMFVVAFAAQYLVGIVIGLFPATGTGYSPEGYSWALGLFLVAQLLALAWYLAAAPHRNTK